MIALLNDPQAPGRLTASDAAGFLECIRRIRSIVDARRVPKDARLVCDVPDCVACLAVRATPFFDCAHCGYHGRPLTFQCDCAKTAASQAEYDRELLREYPTAASWPTHWKSSRKKVAIDAQRLRTLLAAAPVGLCRGEGRGQPAALATLVGFEGSCCHGTTICPTCGAYGDGGRCPDDDAIQYLLAAVRELRAVLGGRGGAR